MCIHSFINPSWVGGLCGCSLCMCVSVHVWLYPVNIEAYGKVFSFALFGCSSLFFLLQADQHLILHLLHIKHVLRGGERTPCHTPAKLTRFLDTHTRTETDLRVLQEGSLVVYAASGSVAEGVLSVGPGAPHHLLLPGLVDTQVGGVDEAAQYQISEVLAEVIKCHPAGAQEKERREDTGENG